MFPSGPWTTDEYGPLPSGPSKTPTVCRTCAGARTARLRAMAAHASARPRVSKDLERLRCMRTSVGVAELLSQEFQLSSSVWKRAGLGATAHLGNANIF